jgi:DNA invertase Pin-like site-specific DNA recombinase
MKYLRISEEDLDLDGVDKFESDSIQNQRALLDDFIARTPEFAGCEVLEELDDGRTGTNFLRPGVQRVIELAERGKIQAIIVKDLSRWGRSYLEVGDFLEQKFPAWGVRFISINDSYDSATLNGTTGGIDIAFRNLIYELYSRDLSDKVISARRNLAKSGKFISPFAFYGYIKDPADKHKLLIDDSAAEIVKRVFDYAESGLSSTQIAKILNNAEVPTAQEHKTQQGIKRNWVRSKISYWQASKITQILSEERYTGTMIFGKRQRVEIGKCEMKLMPESEWIIIPDAFPAIITSEQFEKVRAMMSARTQGKRYGTTSDLMFTRKIKCGNCGHALRPSRYSNQVHYNCATRYEMKQQNCLKSYVREADIKAVVLAAIRQQLKIAEQVKTLRKSKSSTQTVAGLNVEIQNLRRLIDKSKTTKMTLWEEYHSGSMAKDRFQSASDKLSEQVSAYEAKISELEIERKRLELQTDETDTFVERHIQFAGITELTREVLEIFVKEVRVHAADRIEIVMNFADEYKRVAEQLGAGV